MRLGQNFVSKSSQVSFYCSIFFGLELPRHEVQRQLQEKVRFKRKDIIISSSNLGLNENLIHFTVLFIFKPFQTHFRFKLWNQRLISDLYQIQLGLNFHSKILNSNSRFFIQTFHSNLSHDQVIFQFNISYSHIPYKFNLEAYTVFKFIHIIHTHILYLNSIQILTSPQLLKFNSTVSFNSSFKTQSKF